MRGWYSPSQISDGIQQDIKLWRQTPFLVVNTLLPQLWEQATTSVANQIIPQPTPRLSDRVALVSSELLANPQSQAFMADLYEDTNLDGTVPWPNAGGRTEVLSYTVESGDTLYGIAAIYDLDLNTLLWANPNINPENPLISIGQRLLILPVQGVYHLVNEGETLETIATRYGVPETNISNYPPNNLTRPYSVSSGQGLIVPFGRQPTLVGEIPPLNLNTPLTWPLIGLISKGFHAESHPGIRINAPEGVPVLASAEGTVRSISENQGGFIVILEHTDGLESWYGHLQTTSLQGGMAIQQGDMVGEVGGSDSQGDNSYLYFATHQENEALDPLTLLPGTFNENRE